MSKAAWQDRYWDKVEKIAGASGCWIWTGTMSSKDYGMLWRDRRYVLTHRLSWELEHGGLPDDICVLHHCDVPLCVRPDHLFLGTRADNAIDMVAKGRQAKGDQHGFRLHPELVPRGLQHGSRTHPERVPRGERNGMTKLTETVVREIRKATGLQHEIAAQFGVAQTTVGRIRARKSWKHVL